MAQNPLRELNRLGQSVWQDYIRRDELLSGELARLIQEDGLSGVTSNPSIFEKAIAAGQDYDESIRRHVGEGLEGPALFERLAVEDIQKACDLLRATYDATKARDGFVSIEVSPKLARQTEASLAEARRLWKSVGRPNLMVKIPGTREGLPAIQQALAEGININITLLFAVERYVEVAEAYLAALEKRAGEGKPVDRIASVASFFVSRIDSLVDKQLEARLKEGRSAEERKLIEGLFGKVAVANAKAAYQEFRRLFSGPRFEALKKKGAGAQRVLWASTSTKNPKYSDVLYVEDLIGPETVNTLPPDTMIAFRAHGKARLTLEEGVAEARQTLASLGKAGVDLGAATRQLEDDGIRLFADAYDKLLKGLAEKRQAILGERADQTSAALGKLQAAVTDVLKKLDAEKFPQRLAGRDPSLWKLDPAHQKIIKNALGWLSVSESMLAQAGEIMSFAEAVRKEGYQHAIVLGMGGSSLCPDVCRETFGQRAGYPALEVLDSTVPSAIARLEESLDVAKTIFIVSSKSGGTTETLSFFKYFYERVRKLRGERAGENFVAITDPGTSLETLAREKKFRRVFHGQPDIGGRYSALSNFGMVPAALAGVDVRALLEQAERMRRACAGSVAAAENPGLSLGAILAAGARAGRDKVTFFVSPGVRGFANWLEQLIAESTGKEGKGILPVAGEKIGPPEVYGADRLFVHIELADEIRERFDPKVEALKSAGHPLVQFVLENKLNLGQEFYRWEVATATAGSLLAIDAFDQPNVQESKDNTKRILEQFRSAGKLPEEKPLREAGGVKLFGDAALGKNRGQGAAGLGGCLNTFFAQARPGDYVALMAYLEPTSVHKALLQAIRMRLRDSLRLATTLGFGPRFLHSTGQLHKGGAANGLFVQITADDAEDLPVPGEPYTFSVLNQAQALGDLEALRGKRRRVIRVHLGKRVRTGLDQLAKLLESAVGEARTARV
jgi:transaldolase / glucose-6-phosphate isomerase